MDPLSEVLSLLKPQTYMAGGFDLGGAWSVQFPRHEGIKCYAVVAGEVWLMVEGETTLHLKSGDCFLLPRGLPFKMASDPALEPMSYRMIFTRPLAGNILQWNGGGGCFGVGGHFTLAEVPARTLLQELPSVISIQSEEGKTELRWYLNRMAQELREAQPGSQLVVQQLATMMLIQALRLYLEGRPKHTVGSAAGWLAALTNEQLLSALEAMHGEPGNAWTLQLLAERCGMSRTTFAEKFKARAGISPMEYLTRWRMMLAEERLQRREESVAAIAQSLGYESESAFGKAFRRVMGASPRERRRAAREVQATNARTEEVLV